MPNYQGWPNRNYDDNKTTTIEPEIQQVDNVALQIPNVVQQTPIIKQARVPEKTARQLQYEKMLAQSRKYYPYYKVNLSISGYAEYLDDGRLTKNHYLSANQNGQHVFTLKSSDLILAGYEVRVLTECSIRIKYFDYENFLTCDAPTQAVMLAGNELAAH